MKKMHYSVLLKESIDGLNIKDGGTYVDCTLGYAGHSKVILEKNKKGKLFAFDEDENAVKYSKEALSSIGDNFTIFKENFSNLKETLEKENILKVDGFLFDLGFSSPQIDDAKRGFSFKLNAPLDMRMDTQNSLTAKDVVNNYSEEELANIIFEYGEERFARNIARNICKAREEKLIETTSELVKIIEESIPKSKQKDGHPAKRTFQAIRIEVNNEIKPLYNTVLNSIDVLKENGRLCIITFHSLEDRAVKNAYTEAQGKCTCPSELPYCVCNYESFGKIINKKPIVASEEEKERNSRSKSAKVRIFERLDKNT